MEGAEGLPALGLGAVLVLPVSCSHTVPRQSPRRPLQQAQRPEDVRAGIPLTKAFSAQRPTARADGRRPLLSRSQEPGQADRSVGDRIATQRNGAWCSLRVPGLAPQPGLGPAPHQCLTARPAEEGQHSADSENVCAKTHHEVTTGVLG